MESGIIKDTVKELSHRLGLKMEDMEKSIKYWTWKAPPDYREDMLQDIALELLKCQPGSQGQVYAICRNLVCDIWRKWYVRQHYGGLSLDETLDDATGDTLAAFLVGEVDYEAQVCGQIECSRIWQLLPDWVQSVVARRLTGHPVRGRESGNLRRWALEHASILIS